jgi:DNA end-binding protein Ku
MASRSIWRGAISFGLIYIPVNLYSASRATSIDLDMLDKRDFSPIGFQRYNKTTGKPVEWKSIVKGYQYEKGEYVVLTDEDFRRANVEATRTIDIQGFVDRDSIEPYYFDTPYYLAPERSAAKVYTLLREALSRSKKFAIATVVIRTRQHVCALMPVGDLIVLNTLRYQPEILSPPKPEAARGGKKAVAATSKELQMALRLVDEMSEDWKPKQYRDTYREDLMKRIEQKIKAGETKTLTAPQTEEEGGRRAPRGKVVDLMSLLEQSLQSQRGGAQAPAPRRRRRAAARRRTTRSAQRRA